MHAEINAAPSGLFTWVGIPVLFAGVVRLTFSSESHGHWPATLPVNIVLFGIMLAFVAVGTLVIRQRKPEGAASPIYAIVMSRMAECRRMRLPRRMICPKSTFRQTGRSRSIPRRARKPVL